MKHAGTTALIVADAQTGQPAGIITEADVYSPELARQRGYYSPRLPFSCDSMCSSYAAMPIATG
jgi:hypothetical protein